ncbi:MAG: carboxypeptidase regulatory-like domain-containing protein, partial [Nannocystaceae bacterium]
MGTSTGGLALGPAERGSVKATPAGDFSIPRLPTHARVGLHAYTSTCATESTQWLYVAPGERRDDIELSASVHPSLRGNVTASSTGAAIQHAEVTLSSNDLGRTTATTDDGAFVLPRFPRSTSVLQIRAHGYESRAIALDAGTELDRTFISLRPQTTRSMRLSSRRAGTLSVESPPGTLLTNPSSELYFINEGGRVEFSLPDAKWTTIEAIDEDGNLGAIRSSQVDQAKIPAELNMVPTQPFAGLLLDVRDRPILDAAVMLSPVRDATADAAAEVVASLRPRLSYTDDTGIFRIAKSLPGTYELRAWDARGVPISARSSTLKIPADGDNASALPINTTYALRALNGTVVDSDNNPAVGATVTVITAQQDPRATQRHPSGWMPASPRHARADAAGRFSIQVPSDVPFSLVVESQDHAQGTLSGPHDDVSGLTLQLRAYGHLEVNMDKPCAELELTSAHATMSFPLLERNADIERLIPDTYRALFRCGEATIEKTLTVLPGAR